MKSEFMRAPVYFIFLALCVIPSRVSAQHVIRFVDSTSSSGLKFKHEDGADNEGYLVGLMGSGLALFDYDNDSLIDAYFLNGRELPMSRSGVSTCNGLFRNLGNSRFEDNSETSHANINAYSLGTAVADVDNDGFQDVALSNFGSVTLLKNLGDGTFSDITHSAGFGEAGVAFGAGVAFLDIEKDGDVDLYVADYVDFRFDGFEQLARATFPYPPGPEQYEHRSGHLFKNKGDGNFVDCSHASGISNLKSPSMGMVCGDFDDDDDTDIFVCSDARPNLYFENNGLGGFVQSAELAGVAFNASGIPVGSMGAEPGDVNNDGAEDLFITDYSAQVPILFKNLGALGFEDATRTSRIGGDLTAHANWGAGLFDFDNDGDRDLMVGNGHLLKNAHTLEQLTSFKVRNTLLANTGNGIFENVTASGGPGMQIVESSRGLGFDDLDNDGDIDCVVLNNDAAANYLENQSLQQNNWIQIQLCGKSFNRDGIGAKVTVQAGRLVQMAEMRSGRGYQSAYATRLHFGLGAAVAVERVVVDWLGKKDVFTNLQPNRIHLLIEK